MGPKKQHQVPPATATKKRNNSHCTPSTSHLRLSLFFSPKPIQLETQPIPSSTTSRWFPFHTPRPGGVVSFQPPNWGWRPVCWRPFGERPASVVWASDVVAPREPLPPGLPTPSKLEIDRQTTATGPGVFKGRVTFRGLFVFWGEGAHKRGCGLRVEGWWYCLYLFFLWIPDTHQSTHYQVWFLCVWVGKLVIITILDWYDYS